MIIVGVMNRGFLPGALNGLITRCRNAYCTLIVLYYALYSTWQCNVAECLMLPCY